MTTALVLTGGGARGAYQAGALARLLPALDAQGRRPTIYCGASFGAVNATILAATAHLPVEQQAGALTSVWSGVRHRDVLRPFLSQVPRLALRYLTELSAVPGPRLRGMIDASPLRASLEHWIDWDQLAANVGPDGPVDSVLAVATEVATGEPTAFVAGDPPTGDDARIRYVSTPLEADHLLASASIPLLFEATRVEEPGEARGWYCDGSSRLLRPLTLALDAGADDLVLVTATSLQRATRQREVDSSAEPDLTDVVVNVLDALVQDVLVDDLERVGRRARCTVVAPETSETIGGLARQVIDERYQSPAGRLRSDFPLVNWALGGRSSRQAELLSYLLFDPAFIAAAMDRGGHDAEAAIAA